MSKIKNTSGQSSVEEFSSGKSTALDRARAAAKAKRPLFQKNKKPTPRRRITGGDAAQSIEEFRFLECDPITIDDTEVIEECPLCVPDPHAYVPDYLMMGSGEVFFDAKDCRYCVVLTVAPPSLGGPSPSQLDNDKRIQNDIKMIGIRKLLEYYNKSPTAILYYYVKEEVDTSSGEAASALAALGTGLFVASAVATGGASLLLAGVVGASAAALAGTATGALAPDPVPGYEVVAEQRRVDEELLPYTDFKYSIPIQLKRRTKLVIRIDAEAFLRSPENAISEPSTEFETKLETSIAGADFNEFFKHVTSSMKTFNNQFVRWQKLDGGLLAVAETDQPAALDLESEIRLLKVVQQHIVDMLDQAGFKNLTKIENMTFKFEEIDKGLKLKQLIINKFACPEVIFDTEDSETKSLFTDLLKKEGMGQSTTLYYLGALPEMNAAVVARETMPWLDFLLTFTYPGLKVSYGPDSNTLFGDPSVGSCLAQDLLTDSALVDLVGSIENSILGYPDAFLEMFGKSLCLEEEELDNQNDELKKSSFWDETSAAYKRVTEEAMNDFTKGDPYLEAVWDSFAYLFTDYGPAYTGKEKIRVIWEVLNNRLGCCGWIALMMKALDCVAKGMGEEDFKSAMAESAINAMDDMVFQRLVSGLPPEEQARVTEALTEDFANLPAPWDPEYQSGSYAGSAFAKPDVLGEMSEATKVALASFEEAMAELEEEVGLKDPNEITFDESGFPESDQAWSNSDYLRRNSSGDEVTAVQEALIMAGYDVGADGADGYYGPNTILAIKDLQSDAGISSDGVFGPNTLSALNLSVDATKTAYEAALPSIEAQIESAREAGKTAALASVSSDISAIEASALAKVAAYEAGAAEFARDQNSSTQNEFFGVGYKEGTFTFGEQSKGSGGTYGVALGNAQKELFDAYRNATLKSLGADLLLDEMAKLPGAPLVGSFLTSLPCEPTPFWAFDPRIDSFLNTLEFGGDFCQVSCKLGYDLTGPVWSGFLPIGWNNLFKGIQLAGWEALQQILITLVMESFKALLDWLLNAACDALASLGASLMDLFSGSDKFRDLLKENLCPEASDDVLNESLADLFSAIGGPDAACLQNLSSGEMGTFIDDLSLMMTQGQICSLLQGNPDQETMALAQEVAATAGSTCISDVFSDPASIEKLFSSVGRLMSIDDICAQITPFQSELPAAGACPPDVLARIESIKCDLLSQKGLSPEECRAELDKLKEASLQAAKNLGKYLQQGPLADMPPMVSTKCEEGIYASTNPLMQQVMATVTGGMLKPIESSVIKDLLGSVNRVTGNGGFMNAVLSDTKGRPWRTHSFMVKFFGSPLANQLGFFEWASDNAIQNPEVDESTFDWGDFTPDPPIDIYGNELNGDEGTGHSWFGKSEGGFPPTVGAWLAKHYRELNPEFKTIVIPEGYSSVQEAVDDVARLEGINAQKIEKRLEYIDWFIRENHLDDDTGSSKSEVELAGILRKSVYSNNLFVFGNPNQEPEYITDDEKAARQALMGVEVSKGGINVGADRSHPSGWGPAAQARVGTNGQSFSEFWSRQPLGLPMNDIPDISTADVRLQYWNYEINAELQARLEDAETDISEQEEKIIEMEAEMVELMEEEGERTAKDVAGDTASTAVKAALAWSYANPVTWIVPGVGILAAAGAVAGVVSWLLPDWEEKVTHLHNETVSARQELRRLNEELSSVEREMDTYGRGLNNHVVSYDYNLVDPETSALIKTNNYNIKIDVIHGLSPTGGTSNDRKARREAKKDNLPPDSILEESYMKYNLVDLEVESPMIPEVARILRELPLSDNVDDSWQIETFYRLITQAIKQHAGENTIQEISELIENKETRDYFAGASTSSNKKFDQISSGFIKRLANRIATGKSYPEPSTDIEDPYSDFMQADIPEEESEPLTGEAEILDYISPAFRFGYDPLEEPEIIYLDNETYGGPLGQMFPDLIPPPFYVKPPKYTGWLDLIDLLLPTPNSCEPKSMPFFDLSDLVSSSASLSGKLIPDDRMSYDPYCVQEAPYDKIYDNMVLANLEAVMRTICRLYITSNLLQTIPAISQFAVNGENYDEGIFEFIVNRMANGIKEDGRKWTGVSSNEYYFRFMEQIVNNIARKIKSEIIDPEVDLTKEERDAYGIISIKVQDWYEEWDGNPKALSTTAIMNQSIIRKALSNKATNAISGLGAGSADFDKKAALEAKEAALELMIQETEEHAMVFLKKMVREEFFYMGEVFNDKLYPGISNIDHLFLLSDTWIRGAVNPDGPINVVSDPTDPKKYSIPSGMPSSVSSATKSLPSDFGSELETAFSDMSTDEWPFVLEKYVRIIDKNNQPSSTDRSDNLYGIVNIDDWDNYVDKFSAAGNISEFWGEYELNSMTTFSAEHNHRYEIDDEGNGILFEQCEPSGICHTHPVENYVVGEPSSGDLHTHELYKPAWKFGIRICYMPEQDSKDVFEPLMDSIHEDAAMREKAFRVESSGGRRYLIPICSAEIDIPDQELSNFDPASYDPYCLIQELIKTPEYKTWFRYVFPLQRFLTTLTIYSAANFLDSLGNTGFPSEGGDMWETQGGGWSRSFRTWNRKMFTQSRDAARKVFTSLYETNQTDFESSMGDDDPDPNSPTSFLELLKPLVNFEDGLRSWQRGRQVTRKPYNSDGDVCE
jgi:hypothetical protein